jgi:hypothetical protein
MNDPIIVASDDIQNLDNPVEETPLPEEESTSYQTDDKDALIKELEDKNRKLYARLQREKGREDKPATPTAAPASVDTAFILEQAKLAAKGYSEDELIEINLQAKARGISPTKAADLPQFTLWKDHKDKEEKAKLAQLSAARGSRSTARKTFSSSGLSDSEHAELFRQKMQG